MSDGATRPLKIFLCGDVMTGRGIDQVLAHPSDPHLFESYATSALDYVRLAEDANGPIPRGVDNFYIWGDALAEWRDAAPDLRIINLETSVTRSETYDPKGINYRMNPDNVGCLSAVRVDCCVLANNHLLDWGRAGLAETLATLHHHGLKTAGAGLDLDVARAPAIFDIPGGGRVLVFAFGSETSGVPPEWAATQQQSGVNFLANLTEQNAEAIAADIRRVSRPGDVVIVSIHWGGNWGYDVPHAQRHFAHVLIDRANVSIVHGHSSHHPKAIEIYRNRLVLYGCGDFLNDYEGIAGYEDFRDDLPVMYFASIDAGTGDLLALDMPVLHIKRFRLNRAAPADVAWLRDRLADTSGPFGTRIAQAPSGALAASWG